MIMGGHIWVICSREVAYAVFLLSHSKHLMECWLFCILLNNWESTSWSSLRRLVYRRRFYVFQWNKITHRLKHSHIVIYSARANTVLKASDFYFAVISRQGLLDLLVTPVVQSCCLIWCRLVPSRDFSATDQYPTDDMLHVNVNVIKITYLALLYGTNYC